MFTTSSSESSFVETSVASVRAEASKRSGRARRFRLAGFLFTYRRDDNAMPGAHVRIDMYREDPETLERYWITVAVCAPRPRSARKVALALAAWVRSCDVGTRNSVQALAVAESFAMLRERIARADPSASGSIRARRVAND